PLVWPSITEDGVTRLKEYVELTPAEAIQADCDIKAINIILQGLPTEIYALVSQHRVAKDLWEKIKLLMQGTSLTKQERECKLHEVFQVNTKFLNTLPDEWSKFVTDVKLVKDLHTTNVDQLHAYLQQHERHANEVRLMHERNSDPLALVASHQLTQPAYQSHLHTHPKSLSQLHVSPYQSSQFVTPYQTQQFTTNQSTPLSITYPSNEYQSTVHHNVYSSQPSIPQVEYAPTACQQQHPEFSQPDSGLVVPVFQKGDDPIDAINHMMSFLTAVYIPVTVQPVQGRQTTYAAGTTRKYTPGASGSNTGKQRTVICYNCKGEGHIAKQCTKPKRKRDETCLGVKAKLYDGNVILKMDTISESDSDETLMLVEESRIKNAFERTRSIGCPNNIRLESRTFKVKINQVLSENERLLAQAIDNDIVKTIVNLSVNEGCETVNECQKALSLRNMMESSPICLLSKASKTKSWLWHRRLSHLNFGAINHLARHGLVRDVAPAFIITFEDDPSTLQWKTVGRIRTDNGTKFVNQTLSEYYEKVDISHETSVARSPQQNGVFQDSCQTPSFLTPFYHLPRSDWDLLFQPMFDESLNPPPYVDLQAPEVIAPIPEVVAPEHAVSTGSPSSTTVDQDAPSSSNSHTTQETQTPIISHDVEEDNHDIEVAHMGNDPYFCLPSHQVSEHNSKWTKDHPLENIIGALDRPVSTRLQLHEQALFCYYDAFLTSVEPKNYKDALTQACWIEAMQEELHEFERLEVWELVPPPDKAFVITLKWIYKVKLDELGGILKNKARLPLIMNMVVLPNGCEDCILEMLKKASYGLKQAPRAWYDMLSSFLISNDFSKGSVDPTLFIRREGKELLLVQIYVDDIIFAASTPELCDLFAKIMCSKFKMSMMEIWLLNLVTYDTPWWRSPNWIGLIRKAVDPSHYRYQLADIFTKALGRERIEFLINKLGMRSFTPETLKQLADEVDE
ncbi:retrovirus-related pol polyprotein from transposon TNT 1-94, partial [Tanacetum coccineum]